MSVSKRGRHRAPHDLNNTRIRELTKVARHLYPDGQGDYVLDETPAARGLALAIITHLYRAGPRSQKWLFNFCKDRAPWLDPNEIDAAQLKPEKAQTLGNKIGLTAELRTRLGITSIRPCDQTLVEFKAAARDRRKQRGRKYRRLKRAQAGCMTRAAWLEQNSTSRDKPWKAEGISRRTWYRRQRLAQTVEVGTAKKISPPDDSTAARLARGETVGTGVSASRFIVAGRRTCATESQSQPWELEGISRTTWYRRRKSQSPRRFPKTRKARAKAVKRIIAGMAHGFKTAA
jgi:hypothetical protein